MKNRYFRPILAVCLFTVVVCLSITLNFIYAFAIFVFMGLFLVIKYRKSNKFGVFCGIVLLSPLVLLILFFSFIMLFPVFSLNLWGVLTSNGYEIPKESSIFTFRQTQGNEEGNGEYWLYGEDDNYYYGVNVDRIACDSELAPKYYILRKGQESKNFDKLNYKTWDKKEGVGFIPKEYRSYECRREALKVN